MSRIRAFTLIELLIVIAIVAVLGSATVLVLNPTELLAQSRDSSRKTDIKSIDDATMLLIADSPATSLGAANVAYISIPDTSATCANITGLPALPSGWTYRCVTTANLRKIDGTGWMPTDFRNIKGGSPVSVLPIDPKNDGSTGSYYVYAAAAGGFEIDVAVESAKFFDSAAKDGGDNGAVFEMGNSLTVAPNVAKGTSCLDIKTKYSQAASGQYWIDVDGTGIEPIIAVDCDMVSDGGGWTALNANLASIVVNKGTAAWNGSDVVGTGYGTSCSVNVKQYDITSVKIPYNNVTTLLHRTTSILQCSSIGGGSTGYYNPPYGGSYTSFGMCNWADGVWANPCCSATDMTGLKLDWVFKWAGYNGALYYNTSCSSSDTGQFVMRWYVK